MINSRFEPYLSYTTASPGTRPGMIMNHYEAVFSCIINQELFLSGCQLFFIILLGYKYSWAFPLLTVI